MGYVMTRTAVSLFAGIGATALGQQQLGHDVVCVEKWPVAVETLQANFPDALILQADVKKVDWYTLGSVTGPVAVVTGGPPCQPFSQGGLQTGEYDPRDCIPDFVEAVKVLQPELFIMEEVWTLTWDRYSTYFGKVLSDLRDAGYVVDHRVLRMEKYGVDQTRKRLFVVGVRADVVGRRGEGVRWPAESPSRTMAAALGWGPKEAAKRTALCPVPDVEKAQWVYNRASTTVVGSFRPEVQAAPGYRGKGDGPRQNAPGSVSITVEEALTLQGLPADWKVCGKESEVRLQIGNSCPPSMTRQITEVNL